MAGARIEVDVKVPSLERAAKELAGEQRTELLGDIGEYLMRSTRERAAKEIAPDGTPWQALSPRYKRWKDQKRPGVPKLKFDFHMLGDRFTFQVAGDTLLVGTSAKYGAAHQFGGEINIKARQSTVHFKRDRRTGDVGNRFVKRRSSNFAQSVLIPAYKVTMPARPYLGLSSEDDVEVAAIIQQRLDDALDASRTGD